ncbi:C21orf2 (macronuclear) [Tetrahymena thermophila SB210]|uniref:C21orf2 n=1 Tax=Tetrahymena thermophila (strain SB210) TaxID=312017 RepID=Q22X74_TETTS|nr:C21orf2 [Tetrahymena thermophila SB210]EAR89772.1 C21orf2 [Tetrahymena thermophila SB210]|eukprot:XP_001010017.1 C21orf2 [Tetrahymena thermophila SB210]
MGKPLTEELIIQKTKCSSLSQIKNLNLWGSDIDDISILKQIPNAEVLSLSVNKINSLKDFQYCKNLQELYLRKNNISDLKELKYLSGLQNLKVLWLQDNPCAENPDYRKIVISYLPNLSKLDNSQITPQEKQEAQKIQGSNNNFSQVYLNDNEKQKNGLNEIQENQSQMIENEMTNNSQQFEKQNQNIVCAILSLIKDLDINSLEIVRRDVLKKMEKFKN